VVAFLAERLADRELQDEITARTEHEALSRPR
jgi:hypothetical protein